MISEIRCLWCSKLFRRPHGSGPPPQYCCVSHRQRAQERRSKDREIAAAVAAALESLAQDENGPVASSTRIESSTVTKGGST